MARAEGGQAHEKSNQSSAPASIQLVYTLEFPVKKNRLHIKKKRARENI